MRIKAPTRHKARTVLTARMEPRALIKVQLRMITSQLHQKPLLPSSRITASSRLSRVMTHNRVQVLSVRAQTQKQQTKRQLQTAIQQPVQIPILKAKESKNSNKT
ncbi:hypothetical protein CPT76_06625 [Paenibacillus sp. AR247]|nr:hypothetical protein CPT76_06625 [Paenibacillus sp. AR247]